MTLDALCRQKPSDQAFEVIVADDGSDPPLNARLVPYAEHLRIRCIRLEGKGPSAARNAAARLAEAPLLLFLDDDCVPEPDWLTSYLQAYATDSEAGLVGAVVNGLPGSMVTEAYDLVFTFLYTRHILQSDSFAHATQSPFALSGNIGVSANLFRAVGGFDERFRFAAEDRAFSQNWTRSGGKFVAVQGAIVQHHRPLTAFAFLKQNFRSGRGRTMLQRMARERGWSSVAMEHSSFYYQLLVFPFRESKSVHSLGLTFWIFLSQVSVAVGCMFEYVFYPDQFRKSSKRSTLE